MPNRIGLRHLILGALLLAVCVLVWLNMMQLDRVWKRLDDVTAGIADLKSRQVELEERLRNGAVPTGPGPSAFNAKGDAWAVPGVPINKLAQHVFVSDPSGQPGYAPGGTFTEALEGPSAKITTYLWSDSWVRRIIDCICEPLAEFNSKSLELEGVLADAWQMDPAHLWLRVHLRGDGLFSDGRPVTADDVAFTFSLIKNPDLDVTRYRTSFEGINAAKVIDPLTIEFAFDEALFTNFENAMRFPILPRHVYEKWTATPSRFNQSTGLIAGSGPYMFERMDEESQWRPGQPIVLVRNPYFKAAPGRPLPAPDRMRFTMIGDFKARLTSFENGETDMTRVLADQAFALSRDPALAQRGTLLAWMNIQSPYNFIAWNTGKRNGKQTPFGDRRVRQAMTLSLDRERMVRDFSAGLATLSTGPFRPEGPQCDPAIKPWPYDLTRASKLLDDAGWKRAANGSPRMNDKGEELAFEITYVNSAGPAIPAYVKDQAALLGIRVTTRPVDNTTSQQIRSNRDFDALLFGFSPSSSESDPYQTYHSHSIEKGGDNITQFSDPRVDELIMKGRREFDPARRSAIYHELHRILHEEQPCTYLFHSQWLRLVSLRVHNLNPYPTGLDRMELWLTLPSAKAPEKAPDDGAKK